MKNKLKPEDVEVFIKELSKSEMGIAVRQVIKEIMEEIKDISKIDKKILEGSSERLSAEIIGREIALKKIKQLLVTLTDKDKIKKQKTDYT